MTRAGRFAGGGAGVLRRKGVNVNLVKEVREYQSKVAGVFGFNPQAWQDLDKIHQVPQDILEARAKQSNAFRYVNAFRQHGYKYADLNPVPTEGENLGIPSVCELTPSRYGLSSQDTVSAKGLCSLADEVIDIDQLTTHLTQLYCGHTALECHYLENEGEQEWLYSRYEELNQTQLGENDRKLLATEMVKSQAWDNFLAVKFATVKRYGGEGAEAMMGFFTELISHANTLGVEQVVIGMPHRGRLNLLTGLLAFPPIVMFRKMRGLPEFPSSQSGAGDVLSHFSTSTTVQGVHVSLLPNPSHLEAVNPYAVGKARAKHLEELAGDYSGNDSGKMGDKIVCVQVHGDAALAGQGVNQETLQIANVPHFSVGGSIHFAVNNQVGFTTPGPRGRSSLHCTDVAKQIGAPVIHVNGDSPEDLVRATRLAMEYRQEFRKDVFVDLICFRRWGHNELDDPTFTNPKLYQKIHARKSVPDVYSEQLAKEGIFSREDKAKVVADHMELLNQEYNNMESYQPVRENLSGAWSGMAEPSNDHVTEWETGLSPDVLQYVGAKSVEFPDSLTPHPHLKKHHIEGRIKKLQSGANIDWGTAEALAIGSLLYQGFHVRISGQDVGRATFSHRHAMLVDQATNEIFIPLNHIIPNQTGKLEIANSILSEEAVLAFEYGMATHHPNNFIIWEAQFGDFFNGAQIMLDTLVSCGESKWGLQCGLVMLLPHGMDGAGPEHSSCRIERFLQLSDSLEAGVDGDNVNWEVVNPTTAGQYFHLLRRQMVRNHRKPLVVAAPKVILRLPAAAATLADIGPGTSFQSVLSDPAVSSPDSVTKLIFVSGKHYYTLSKHIQENNIKNVAVIRLESICPFPTGRLQTELAKYKNAQEFVWSQEEHRNMGCWSFVRPRFENLVGVHLRYAGRGELCQPAVGVGKVHQAENKQIVEDTFS